MAICMLCARRGAILAALAGGFLLALAAADYGASGAVVAGTTLAHYGAAALTSLGL